MQGRLISKINFEIGREPKRFFFERGGSGNREKIGRGIYNIYTPPAKISRGGLIRINLIFAGLDKFRFDYLTACLPLL